MTHSGTASGPSECQSRDSGLRGAPLGASRGATRVDESVSAQSGGAEVSLDARSSLEAFDETDTRKAHLDDHSRSVVGGPVGDGCARRGGTRWDSKYGKNHNGSDSSHSP